MRVCVFGAGSLGSAVGGILSAKHEVVLVGRRAHMSAIDKRGLVLSGDVRRTVRVGTSESVKGLSSPELVIVTTKAYDTDSAIAACRAWSSRSTKVLTLQNGLGNLEKLRAWKHASAFGGTTTMGAQVISPGEVRVSGLGRTVIGGDLDEIGSEAISNAFSSCGLPCEVVSDINSEIWSKAVVSACINPLTAILRVPNGRLLESDVIMKFLDELCDECVDVCKSSGVGFASEELITRVLNVARKTARNRSSMLQDIENGRRTEIGHINGEFSRLGEKRGVDVPLNRALTAMVGALERNACKGKG